MGITWPCCEFKILYPSYITRENIMLKQKIVSFVLLLVAERDSELQNFEEIQVSGFSPWKRVLDGLLAHHGDLGLLHHQGELRLHARGLHVSIDRERQEISINFVCFSVRESRSSTVRSARSSSSTM